jgi:hypothetical protein
MTMRMGKEWGREEGTSILENNVLPQNTASRPWDALRSGELSYSV